MAALSHPIRSFALLLALLMLAPSTAVAKPVRAVTPIAVKGEELGTVTFANLVLHAPEVDEILMVNEKVVLAFLEEMRAHGYRALGGESLTFGQDESHKAQFVLGGTIKELAQSEEQGGAFGIGVEWELLHVASKSVVYRALVRHEEIGVGRMDAQSAGNALFLGALRGLLARPKFVEALKLGPDTPKPAGALLPPGQLRRCVAEPIDMTQKSADALRATAVVKTSGGVGSAVVVSPDGILLTAAHVVTEDQVTVRFKDGQESRANVLRVDDASDVALIQLQKGQQDVPCLQLAEGMPDEGTDVYALGSPTGDALAFSVSRGIVSGRRTIEGSTFLQTDASLSPGNSGGPLVNKEGRVVAIVSFKVTGEGVEGLGFGVPSSAALDALSIELGENTGSLLVPRARAGGATLDVVVDAADPPFYYIGKHARGRTPGWVKPVRGFGWTFGVLGASAIAGTALAKENPDNWSTLKTWNTVGWAAAFAGTGMILSSYVFKPRRQGPESPPASPGAAPAAATPGPTTRLDVGAPGLGPASLSLTVTF